MQTSSIQLLSQSKALIETIIGKMSGVSKPQKKFSVFMLQMLLSLRVRKTVLNMSRWSGLSEKTIRLQLQKPFSWEIFNSALVQESGVSHSIIALDPSYLPKSGKKTYGKDKFWSGVAGAAKDGIEFCGIGIVDLDRHTALHWRAFQTPDYASLKKEQKDLLGHYCRVVSTQGYKLRELSRYLVVDAYFSKEPFINTALLSDLDVISKFRIDVRLRYLAPKTELAENQKRPAGRPPEYAGKIDVHKPDKRYMKRTVTDKAVLYSAVVNVEEWKANLKVVIIMAKDESRAVAVLLSTDTELDPLTIVQYYTARFQIEFLYRDAKQFAGMTHCQCRSKEKLDFHVNAALTAVSVAKAAHFFDPQNKGNTVYSIADIQNRYVNENMIDRIISMFGIDANMEINQERIRKLYDVGRIAT